MFCSFPILFLVSAPLLLPAVHGFIPEWVDPQTPPEARTATGMDGRRLQLVFSDEFSEDNRPFHDGADTRWTAEDRPGTTNAALHYYNSSHVTTKDGKLVIQTSRKAAFWVENDPNSGQEYYFDRKYQSGMLSTWNKMCFTSGMIELSFQLPGKPLRGGLWPAFWMLGNLARPSYLRSTDGIWPWSMSTCGSSQEAREAQQVQEIDACTYGKGRGSPEIDIIEAQPGDTLFYYNDIEHVDGQSRDVVVGRPMISSSLQVSPGISRNIRPQTPDFPQPGEWYPELYPMGGEAYGNHIPSNNSDARPRMINNYWYGQKVSDNPEVWQDGLSCNWQHSETFHTQQSILRTEWQAGDDGYVRWFTGDGELIYEITAEMLRNKPGAADAIAEIPYEAMYLILNTDISPRWGWNGCDPNDPCMQATGLCNEYGELTCKDCGDPQCLQCPSTTAWLGDFCNDIRPEQPAEYLIDYVRVYQDPNDPLHTLGCDPPSYPTKQFIEDHWDRYTFNPYKQKQPLVKVEHGGASCNDDADCGNVLSGVNTALFSSDNDLEDYFENLDAPIRRSFCVNGQCQCPDDWTGPTCKSPCVGDYAHCSSDSVNTSGTPSERLWNGLLACLFCISALFL